MPSLEQRIARLEAIEAIKQVKAQYLSACDRKDPAAVRACFVDGDMLIDYDRVGVLNSADELTSLFERFGCEPHVIEMHHAQNPVITIEDEDNASGSWGLYYHLIDTRADAVTQLGGSYEDHYRRVDGAWKIAATTFRLHSSQLLSLEEGVAKVIFAGRAAPDDDVSRQAADSGSP